MKICLACGCEIVKMHRTDADCLKALSVQIPRLQKRLQELVAAQHRLAADGKPAEPLFTYKWHCSECGKWHSEKEFYCPRPSPAAKA